MSAAVLKVGLEEMAVSPRQNCYLLHW